MKLILIISLGFLFSCVSYNHGTITNSYIPNQSHEYVDIAVGYTKANYFLGYGGWKSHAYIYDAKKKMYNSRILEKGEFFANLVHNEKVTIYPFCIVKVEHFVVADVIKGDTNIITNFSENYKLFNTETWVNNRDFKLNDKVIFYDYNRKTIRYAKVLDLDVTNCVVLYNNHKNNSKIKNLGINEIFKFEKYEVVKDSSVINIGDKNYMGLVMINDIGFRVKGEIIGLNKIKALIKSDDNVIHTVDLNTLKKITD
jgi:hypothetical protein